MKVEDSMIKRENRIRLAEYEDLDAIFKIYETAREYMRNNGNPTQWGKTYPSLEVIQNDIREKHLYVYVEEGKIHGVFAFIPGEDVTYRYIEDGAWKNQEPYGTIHRLAGDGEVRGIFASCMEFCKGRMGNLRVDTHRDNKTMRYLLQKNGFEECGIIYLADKSSRIAYQYVDGN